MRVLVTGGAGMIGAFLLPKLLKSECDVIVVDDLSRGKAENIPPGCTLIEDSVANLMSYAEQIGHVDVVFHLASFMFGLGFSEGNHSSLYDNNSLISNGLMNFLGELKKSPRVVFVSSSCVYSDDGEAVVDENSLLGEFPERANLGYGYSKRHMEDRLKLGRNVHGYELSIVRPFNIYGESYKWAGQLSQAIPMLVDKIMTSNIVEVWGSGNQRRTYVHAEDCAELIYRMGFSKYNIELINIGHEHTISLNELAKKIAKLANKQIDIINVVEKPEGRFVKACKTKTIIDLFPDYKYNIDLNAGLLRMIKWWHRDVSLR